MRWISLALLTVACSTSIPPADKTTLTSASTEEPLARVLRERDDANRRAVAAEGKLTAQKDECDTAKRDLAKLHERDVFEQSIWIRLEQVELTIHSLGDFLPQANRDQKKSIQRAIDDALPLRAEVEHQIRRIHAITDNEWPHFQRELGGKMDKLEDVLHPLL